MNASVQKILGSNCQNIQTNLQGFCLFGIIISFHNLGNCAVGPAVIPAKLIIVLSRNAHVTWNQFLNFDEIYPLLTNQYIEYISVAGETMNSFHIIVSGCCIYRT